MRCPILSSWYAQVRGVSCKPHAIPAGRRPFRTISNISNGWNSGVLRVPSSLLKCRAGWGCGREEGGEREAIREKVRMKVVVARERVLRAMDAWKDGEWAGSE